MIRALTTRPRRHPAFPAFAALVLPGVAHAHGQDLAINFLLGATLVPLVGSALVALHWSLERPKGQRPHVGVLVLGLLFTAFATYFCTIGALFALVPIGTNR